MFLMFLAATDLIWASEKRAGGLSADTDAVVFKVKRRRCLRAASAHVPEVVNRAWSLAESPSFTSIYAQGRGTVGLEVGGQDDVQVAASVTVIPDVVVGTHGSMLVLKLVEEQQKKGKAQRSAHVPTLCRIRLSPERLASLNLLTCFEAGTFLSVKMPRSLTDLSIFVLDGACLNMTTPLVVSRSLSVNQYGTGTSFFQFIKVPRMTVNKSGSGTLEVEAGSVDDGVLDVESGGHVRASGFRFKRLALTHICSDTRAGLITCNATERLSGTLSGAATVVNCGAGDASGLVIIEGFEARMKRPIYFAAAALE